MVVTSAVKLVKGWNALTVGADYLGIHDRGHIESRRFLHDKRIAIAPIVSIDRLKPPPTTAAMDLQPITVMLQLMRPTRPVWRPLGDDWLARMNESGGRV